MKTLAENDMYSPGFLNRRDAVALAVGRLGFMEKAVLYIATRGFRLEYREDVNYTPYREWVAEEICGEVERLTGDPLTLDDLCRILKHFDKCFVTSHSIYRRKIVRRESRFFCVGETVHQKWEHEAEYKLVGFFLYANTEPRHIYAALEPFLRTLGVAA